MTTVDRLQSATPDAHTVPAPHVPGRVYVGLNVAVTGGTSGLGLALVRELMTRGAHVAFVARTRNAVQRVASEHPGAHGIVGDVANLEDIYPIAVQILGALGTLDVIVNNASTLGPSPLALLADTDCEDFERALATNVLGPFRLTKALLGSLASSARERSGAAVVNVSSDAALNAYPRWGAYGASKAALHHLSRIWHEELAGEGISVLSFDPGDMDTPLHAAAVPDADRSTLKRPEDAARELANAIGETLTTARECDSVDVGGEAMTAAGVPEQRAQGAKVLAVDRVGRLRHWRRRDVVRLFHPGDLVIANDAATIPASLTGRHVPSGRYIEARLAGRESLHVHHVSSFTAVLFGLGDFRMRTEDRPLPPHVEPGDRLQFGPLQATVTRRLHGHPRLVVLEFVGAPAAIWDGLARHGRPVQYAHVTQPLVLWDTWTPIAAAPVAFEPPSAAFAIDWQALASMRSRRVHFATVTHAAGLSSTGDPALDALLPFDEPYRIPERTAWEMGEARRIVAVGTTVVRALEHAATHDGIVRPGEGVATQRIGSSTPLRVVDAILSGTHERGSSHYELLRAFADDETLSRIEVELNTHDYRTHEFGDSVFLERMRSRDDHPRLSIDGHSPSGIALSDLQLDDSRRQPSGDDGHARNADWQAETSRSRAAGIEVEHAVTFLDRRNVRVSVDDGADAAR